MGNNLPIVSVGIEIKVITLRCPRPFPDPTPEALAHKNKKHFEALLSVLAAEHVPAARI
jgi:hypothetical protein